MIGCATELDHVVVHAHEECLALERIGMWEDFIEVVVAHSIGNVDDIELASDMITGSANDSQFIKDQCRVAEEVNTLSDHANEEVYAAIGSA